MTVTDAGPGAPQGDETGAVDTYSADTADDAPGAQSDANEGGDTFPREVVERLRSENAGHRTKTKAVEDRADALAKQLHTALVTATGKLENPAELPFDPEHLENGENLSAAIEALIEAKPYLAKRLVKGDAGQGQRGGADGGVNLLSLLKGGR
jgi:hypothetical protein